MLAILLACFLGFVQGVTEFLPVSSSGHLVMFQQLLGAESLGLADHVAFDLVLHIGTLVPVLLFYRGDIRSVFSDLNGTGPFLQRPGVRLAAWVVLGTIPTGIIGVALKDVFEQLFTNITSVGVALLVTGTVLYQTGKMPKGERDIAEMTWKDALIIGLAQGIAITPGISRSGSTIAVAMLLGLRRDLAARFSFLLSVPAILGAFVLKSRDLDLSANDDLVPLLVGFAIAAGTGWGALVFLVRLVKAGDFSRFSYYLWPVGTLALLWGLFTTFA